MTVYAPILNAEINPDKPIKSSIAYRFRDNPLAIAEGDPTAPSINPAAVAITGKGIDGAFTDASAFGDMGYYDFTSILRTIALTTPFGAIVRSTGNVTISSTVTVGQIPRTDTTDVLYQQRASNAAALMRGILGLSVPFGVALNPGNGGGSYFGGQGAIAPLDEPINRAYNLFNRAWNPIRPIFGGNGGLRSGGTAGLEWGPATGALIIIAEGAIDLTGGTISANGGDTNAGGPGVNSPGAGGAGSIIIISMTQIIGGTFNARGGNANQAAAGTGGWGCGGLIQLLAPSFAGVQTTNVLAGTSDAGPAPAAYTGFAASYVIPRDSIRAMISRN